MQRRMPPRQLPKQSLPKKKNISFLYALPKILFCIIFFFLAVNIITGFYYNKINEEVNNYNIKTAIKDSNIFYKDYFFLTTPCKPYIVDKQIILDSNGEKVCITVISYNILFYGNIAYLIGYYAPLIISFILLTLSLSGILYKFTGFKVKSIFIIYNVILIILCSLVEMLFSQSNPYVNFLGNFVLYYTNVCIGNHLMSKITIGIIIILVICVYIIEKVNIPKLKIPKFNFKMDNFFPSKKSEDDFLDMEDMLRGSLPDDKREVYSNNTGKRPDDMKERQEVYSNNTEKRPDDISLFDGESVPNFNKIVPNKQNDGDKKKVDTKVVIKVDTTSTTSAIKDKIDHVVGKLETFATSEGVVIEKIQVIEKPRLIEYRIFVSNIQKRISPNFIHRISLIGYLVEENEYLQLFVNKYTREELKSAARDDKLTLLLKPDFNEFLSMLDNIPASNIVNRMLFSPGIDIHGQPLLLDVLDCVHIGICGSTTSGKTNTILTALSSLFYLNTPNFEVWVADPTKILVGLFGEYVTKSAEGTDNVVNLIEQINEMIDVRNDILNINRVANYSDLPIEKKFPPIIFVIDELQSLFNNCDKVTSLLKDLANSVSTGSKVGVYFWVGTQILTKSTTGTSFYSNLQTKWVHWLPSDSDTITAWSNSSVGKQGNARLLQGFGDFYCGSSDSIKRGHSIRTKGSDIQQLFIKIKEKKVCQTQHTSGLTLVKDM